MARACAGGRPDRSSRASEGARVRARLRPRRHRGARAGGDGAGVRRVARGGHAGEMAYLARGAEKRRDTRLPLPGTTHAIVVALDYGGKEPSGPGRALRARRRLPRRDGRAAARAAPRGSTRDAGRAVRGKPYVDTGPLLERDLARRAGLGWFGKNTNLINPERGLVLLSRRAAARSRARDRTRRSRRTAAERARGASRRVRRSAFVGAAGARCDAVHLVPHDRAARARSRRSCARRSGSCSTGATSARTCVRGTCGSRRRCRRVARSRRARSIAGEGCARRSRASCSR